MRLPFGCSLGFIRHVGSVRGCIQMHFFWRPFARHASRSRCGLDLLALFIVLPSLVLHIVGLFNPPGFRR